MFAPGASFPAPQHHSVDRVIEALIQGLVDLGERVLVLAPAASRTKGELIPVGSAPILLRDDPTCKHLQEAQASALREVERLGSEIDLVHAHGLDITGVLYSTHLLTSLAIPNVTTLHSAIDTRDYGYFANCKNNIVACSASQWRACPPLNVVSVVHHGLESALYPLVEEPEHYLCFVGRIDPVKQPHLAIELAIQCGMRIKIAGGTATEESMHYFASRIEPLIHHPLVEYLGEIGFSEKVRVIGRACCNLHPTGFREPFGLSVIEAGFCGTPTLAISRGSLPEIVVNGETGILVEDFVEGCHRLSECLKLDRRRVSEHTKKRFDLVRMAYDYVDVYKMVLQRISTTLPSYPISEVRPRTIPASI
jgi:glycosyltransferase involved in cell wall biosynthesis